MVDHRMGLTGSRRTRNLRKRGLRHKRARALREYALGVETWKRFVVGEPAPLGPRMRLQ